MTLSTLLTQKVSVIRPGRAVNRVGDPILDWSDPTYTSTLAFVEAVSGGEDQFLRTSSTGNFRVFFFPTIPIEHKDLIEWDDGDSLGGSTVLSPGPFSKAFGMAFKKGKDVIIGGHVRTLEVVGPPRRRFRPSGLHHIEVSATEWIG